MAPHWLITKRQAETTKQPVPWPETVPAPGASKEIIPEVAFCAATPTGIAMIPPNATVATKVANRAYCDFMLLSLRIVPVMKLERSVGGWATLVRPDQSPFSVASVGSTASRINQIVGYLGLRKLGAAMRMPVEQSAPFPQQTAS